MSYKDSFDLREWESIQFGLMWVFRGVAGADGKIDKEEQKALATLIKSSQKIPNEFTKEVFKSIEENVGLIFRKCIADPRLPKQGLEELSSLLDQKLSLEDSLIYRKMLTAIGIYIANASGAEGDNISEEEVDQLSKLAFHLKLKTEELKSSPNVYEILQYFTN